MSDLHQQRVQAELNQLKRDALDSFMKAIRSEPTDVTAQYKLLNFRRVKLLKVNDPGCGGGGGGPMENPRGYADILIYISGYCNLPTGNISENIIQINSKIDINPLY